jgi:hypothetical protein
MSELVVKEILSDEYVNQVRPLGALNYPPERICQLLALRKAKREALLYRIALPGDVYFEAYQQGLALGEYNIDAELAKKAEKGDNDSITLLEERKNERAEKDLRMKLFGI